MHGWACNKASVLNNMYTDRNDKQSINFEITDSIEKILGLRWVNSSDELIFNINTDRINQNIRTGVNKPTKREFSKVIMSIFDPLGFLTPFIIESKLIMQSVWSSKIGWDEKLQDTEFVQWKQWLQNLERIKSCRIPRCYQLKNCQVKCAELHIFCDASTKAYASVAYWRFCLNDGSYHVALIMAKSRVAPMKDLATTIPRLELQAAVLVIRIANIVIKEHDFQISRRVFWSDSMTVLHWINKEPREFKIFVANRLAEISENSSASEWRWIPSSENPADDGTRIAPDVLNKESRWLLEPAFLKKSEEKWPVKQMSNFDKDDSERREKTVFCAFTITKRVYRLFNFPQYLSRFSSWLRLINPIIRFYEAINKMRKININLVEIRKKAEKICLEWSQSITFSAQINALKNKLPIPKKSRIAGLNAFLDEDGLLGSESRLINVRECETSSRPIILEGSDKITRLLVQYYHENCFHGSHKTVINELRQSYWIVGLRHLLRSIVSNCAICKWFRSNPSIPKMAALPLAHLDHRMRPFSHCGIDYFGPLIVKIGYRRREKSITCKNYLRV